MHVSIHKIKDFNQPTSIHLKSALHGNKTHMFHASFCPFEAAKPKNLQTHLGMQLKFIFI